MAAERRQEPQRYAVQRGKPGGWKTVHVDEDEAAARSLFCEMVRLKKTGYFRVIRLAHNPEADYGGHEYNWTLIALHDPKRGGSVTPAAPPRRRSDRPRPRAAQARGTRGRRSSERLPLPVILYTLFALVGAVLAVVAYMVYGPSIGEALLAR